MTNVRLVNFYFFVNREVYVYLSFQITFQDGLPGKICLECASQVSKVYSFKKQCERSDATLRERFSFKCEDTTVKDSAEPIKLDKDDNNKITIKTELNESIDIQSDGDYHFPESNSTSDSDSDPESKMKLSKLKMKQLMKSLETVEKSFACDVCNKTFSRNSYLTKHFQTHINLAKDNHKDSVRSQTQEERLPQISETVIIKKDGDKKLNDKFICSRCERRFNKKQSLESHMALHRRNEKSKTCEFCKKTFIHSRYLAKHIKNAHSTGKTLKCEICGKRFSKGKLLLTSIFMILNHANAKEFSHLCCPRNFRIYAYFFFTADQLTKHSKRHENTKSHECLICQEVFQRKHLLMDHLKIHTVEGDKPYACPTCGKSFKQLGNLKEHIDRHTGIKRHLCFTCGETYATKQGLTLHLQWHSGKKPHKCDVCNATYTRLYALNAHKLTHTGEIRHKCDVCQKKFINGVNLRRHKLIHTGEKPHACSYCPKAFKQRVEMVAHIRSHTGERPYSCEICDHNFTQKSSLNTHMKKHKSESPAVPVSNQSILNFPKVFKEEI